MNHIYIIDIKYYIFIGSLKSTTVIVDASHDQPGFNEDTEINVDDNSLYYDNIENHMSIDSSYGNPIQSDVDCDNEGDKEDDFVSDKSNNSDEDHVNQNYVSETEFGNQGDNATDEDSDHQNHDRDSSSDVYEDNDNEDYVNADNQSDEDNSSDDGTFMDDINFDEYIKQPVYNGTDLTPCAAICSVMQFALSNNFTNEAIEKLLKLFKLLLPTPNHLPSSLYKLKTFFSQFSVPFRHSKIYTTCSSNNEDCHCQLKGQISGNLLQISLAKPLSAVVS